MLVGRAHMRAWREPGTLELEMGGSGWAELCKCHHHPVPTRCADCTPEAWAVFGSVPAGVRGVCGVMGRRQGPRVDLLDQRVDLAAQEEQVSSPIRGDGCRQSLARWKLCCWAVPLVKAHAVFDGKGEMRGRF